MFVQEDFDFEVGRLVHCLNWKENLYYSMIAASRDYSISRRLNGHHNEQILDIGVYQ